VEAEKLDLHAALRYRISPPGTDWALKFAAKHTLLAHGVAYGVAKAVVDVVKVVRVIILAVDVW